ncbi:hypothetical protein BDV93DRAFT_563037 [Ceratobasidium sp. AG-I]|nr:hypothetical protein BDV93DRAFT_563037 [Ceratobasidium sp. AG-I]
MAGFPGSSHATSLVPLQFALCNLSCTVPPPQPKVPNTIMPSLTPPQKALSHSSSTAPTACGSSPHVHATPLSTRPETSPQPLNNYYS